MPLPKGDPRVRLNRCAFVIYNHRDVEKANKFLVDFGFILAEQRGDDYFYRGYSSEPILYWLRKGDESSFGGACYAVEDRDELVKATKIEGATQIRALKAPGGGEWVTIRDPLGFPVHLVFGQKPHTLSSSGAPSFPSHVVNYEDEDKKPRKGNFLRLEKGPAPVFRWGHYGITYPEGRHDEMFEWYTKHIAIAPSDQLERDGKTIVTFFHIDRAKDFTDHHCFFFKPAKGNDPPSVAHSAFEVHDFDVQHLGHQHLESKNYELCWGVGRHILGSQVFDYWFDTSGFVVEHYCDGDLVNEDTEVSHSKAGPQSLKIWGPPVPTVF